MDAAATSVAGAARPTHQRLPQLAARTARPDPWSQAGGWPVRGRSRRRGHGGREREDRDRNAKGAGHDMAGAQAEAAGQRTGCGRPAWGGGGGDRGTGEGSDEMDTRSGSFVIVRTGNVVILLNLLSQICWKIIK